MDLEKANRDTHVAIKELRETIESKTADKEKVAKIERDLDRLEVVNQKLVADLSRQKAAAEELEQKYNYLDTTYSSMPGASHRELDVKYINELKSFNDYCRYGEMSKNVDVKALDGERKYLRTDSGVDGGFLVPPQFVREIIKGITEVSPIRSIALVKTSDSKSMEQPIRTTLLTAGWVGEGETGQVSNSKYGTRRIQVKRLFVESQITVEELEDAAFDMAQEIRDDVVEKFAQTEGLAFVKGDGINQPFGFMTSADVSAINSGIAADISFDNFFDLQGNLKTGYTARAMYGLNRLTLARARKLKTSGSGEYLWTAGNLAAGMPNAIAGSPYVEMPDLDNIGANTFPVIYADFRSFYQIADRTTMEVIRDPYVLKREGKVAFAYYMRVGGDVRQPEAGIKLKCSL